MTPDELDAIRDLTDKLSAETAIKRVLTALLAYVDELEGDRARSVVRYADAVIAAGRVDRLRATITELCHHGDMTPTAKRVLLNVLEGAE